MVVARFLRLLHVRACQWRRLQPLPGLRPSGFRQPARTLTTPAEPEPYTRRKVEAMMKRSRLRPEFPSPNLMRLHLPGLSQSVIDTQGQRQLVCYLMKLFDLTMFYWPLPVRSLDEPLMFFMLTYDMHIQPSLYDDLNKWPLVIEGKMNYVKRSSCYYQLDLAQSEQNAPLATSRFTEVYIDPETRRPRAFPQWWKDENCFPEDGPKPNVNDVTKPETGVLVTERRIHFTDTDENNHTNFASYVRMSLDTFYEHVLNGKYNNSSPVFINGWIKNMSIVFKSDSVLGDILTVDSWEDGDFPNTFHFEMRKGQEVTATVSLTFYSSLK